MAIKNLDKKIRAYTLKNAIAHEGKANPGSVVSALFNEGLKKEEVKDVIKDVNKIVGEINKLSLDNQKKEYDNLQKIVSEREIREGLDELPNVKKSGVVMRFRPAPSGPLHVGHIIANLSSSLYVKKYGGKFYIIIDDTDPSTVLKDAYKNIKEDCDWIFGNVYKYINSSDRMDIYYKYAEELIKKSSAYVCTCSQEAFKHHSESQTECSCRHLSVEENSKRWKNMLSKKGFKEGEAVVRFKSNMTHKNPAMRDFPLARISLAKHPIQKSKYRVWPLMNLVVSVDDIEYGMTHVIRGKDHMDNAERQKMIFEVFGKKYPWVYFIGRVKFTDLILSKRKINSLINSGEFSGADDVRLPTITSLRKRGYKPEAFIKFIEQRGLTEVDKVISGKDLFDVLDRFNA